MTVDGSTISRGFPAVLDADCRLLVMGSLPGQRSIAEQQYYAHPRNAFWPIMQEVFGIDAALDYRVRCRSLVTQGIGLWDVLKTAQRPGSMDAAITVDSSSANDIAALLRTHRRISIIAFNGRKAAELFRRFCGAAVDKTRKVELVTLPSTSPAHAAMSRNEKMAHWSVLRDYLANPARR